MYLLYLLHLLYTLYILCSLYRAVPCHTIPYLANQLAINRADSASQLAYSANRLGLPCKSIVPTVQINWQSTGNQYRESPISNRAQWHNGCCKKHSIGNNACSVHQPSKKPAAGLFSGKQGLGIPIHIQMRFRLVKLYIYILIYVDSNIGYWILDVQIKFVATLVQCFRSCLIF